MDSTLFSNRSMPTMKHSIVLGGGALMALAAALFSLRAMRRAGRVAGRAIQPPERKTPYRARRNAPSTISRTPGG